MHHQDISEVRLNVVSLYTGAGGLDLGFEAAGFRTRVAVEMDNHARETLRTNRPDWKQPQGGDALRLNAQDLLNIGGLAPGEVDALIGGPPCQPFSKSAFWVAGSTKRLDDPRARTLGAMLDFAEAFLPRVLMIENVRGIAYREKDEAAKLVEQRLAEINGRHHTQYTISIAYLQATNFGVPQVRERAFLVAFRDGQRFEAPAPITGPDSERPIATAWDAIGEIGIPEAELKLLKARGKWGELLGSIPEGQNYLWHTDRGQGLPLFGWRTRFWSFLLKLAKDKPAWTIQANPGPATGPFHWDGRLLSVSEMARLQSFPIGYSFAGDYRAARRQIGNAVPPALAEAVARRIAATLQGMPYSPLLCMAVPFKGPAPSPTPPGEVPEKYRQLIGNHDAHPGSGKGPAALLRMPASNAALGREDPDAMPADLGSEEHAAA
ncbi:DNA cytosine methyltransferase [Rhizobium ruizarguesonis]|uniref:DNA cytosine methyltransferase n=1 Tax=Rhizobium ruizarguesonis TaxID=2081791 RepID=UPI00103188F2|nr:DNA cytosine methyltransferase [Rhizobium ruizarguesonis]TBB03863.1 DNA cytosine methyltransferase [Rhizobium ruizarguesonis]